MPRFFVSSDAIDCVSVNAEGIPSGTIAVRGDDAAHITKVLRMKPGEHVTVCDLAGHDYETVVASTGTEVLLTITGMKPCENEPPYRVTVYQSLVRGDRFDTVLQKATELGAYAIVPVLTSRCTVKLDIGSADCRKKLERWQRIVYEAAKQCGRGIIPTVREPMKFRDAAEDAARAELPLFCYEGEGTKPLPECMDAVQCPETVSVMIGPEGGYAAEEAEYAAQAGMSMTGLGKRILRTETAPSFVLSCVSYKYEL
ncbi:MAG: 16S rRNA (uracil(1498)-N(3))-methyltransferase [Clostridia bacterium]|nr:16S rRNA (uracil(1498)-N(3))-methyltransferase [Clostridia bacterium]MBQ9997194.1 16S rRNA (uracil(1498)-N(3))-methyltransferase [Clostridia bacterium]